MTTNHLWIALVAFATACGSVAGDGGACKTGSMSCDGVCVDLQSDQTDCGACGHACGASEACVAGTCTLQCPSGFAACGNVCADLDNDPDHCGACDTVCGPTNACEAKTCVGQQWESLTPLNPTRIPSFTDFTPAGQTSVYDVNNTSLFSVAADGTSTPLAAIPTSVGLYVNPAWVGTKLYVINAARLQIYDIAQNAWTAPITTLAHTSSDNQATSDGSDFVYTTTTDKNLLILKVADNSVTYVAEPAALTTSEPRAAWDTKSNRLYLADYNNGPLFAFNPADQSFTPLTPIPANTTSDGFCSDRNGHLFTASSDCSHVATMFMYTIATDTWSELPTPPFAHGCNTSCSVGSDGYLYLAEGQFYNQARIKL